MSCISEVKGTTVVVDTPQVLTDEQRLAELGYKQELNRSWSGFSNFAISFSIISILAGCFTTFGVGWNNGGPAGIAWGWPIIAGFILIIGFCMSELVSAFPTSGGIYWWASKLGGVKAGYYTGWLNLIGLLAIVASVAYGAATFLDLTIGAFASGYHSGNLDRIFLYFVVILLAAGLVNIFSSHLLAVFNNISVWWHVAGAALVVIILAAVPKTHLSVTKVFGTWVNNTGFFGGHTNAGFIFFIIPLGFILTQYTITGYDASAHVSEETSNAAEQAPKGVWRSVFYSAVIGWIVLLAITFAIHKHNSAVYEAGFPALEIFESALSSAAAKAVVLISTIGQIFCGMACVTSASRMTFAFSRDGAVPGHKLWRRLGSNRTPTWAVLFVCMCALIITIPAYFPNHLGTPVAFLAVTSISVIGLYIAYTIPVFLRWRMREDFKAGPWTLGAKYKWMNPVAFTWVGLCVIIFCLPFAPAGVFFKKGFEWSAVNYAPLVTIGVMAAVTIWFMVSAKNTFKGPVRTIEDVDPSLPEIAQAP
jgi:amino acid transporter